MRFSLVVFALVLGACSSQFGTIQPTAEKALENVSCSQSQSGLYDVLYASLQELNTMPTENELKEIFNQAIESRPEILVEEEKFLSLVSEFHKILSSALIGDSNQILAKLTALEVGDQTTEEARKLQSQLIQFQKKWDEFRIQQKAMCNESPEVFPPESIESKPVNQVVFGARKSLATAYQSCEALEKTAMKAETPDVIGISRVGTHPDGIGGKRLITDLKAVQETHYYLKTKDQSSSCLDISKNPMIYDYGGKPYVSAGEDSSLDFFKNAGSGTVALGIDCSGYVFSAVAAGGLKIHPDKKMKAIFSHGISARMYMDPLNNGMPCFKKVKMGASGTLRPGDIAAVPGHVVIIDSVGKDPFGLRRAQDISQCQSLNSDGFDFVVIQSSPSKKAIGINRYEAADYLRDDEGSIKVGLEKYAQDACRAKFKNEDIFMKATGFQVVRHKQTKSCMDQPIALAGENCVSSCHSLASSGSQDSFQTHRE